MEEGHSGAADTFRAAAIEQRRNWPDWEGREIILPRQGSDPESSFTTVERNPEMQMY